MTTRISSTHSRMRKEPRQARSRATVDSIVQAGARVLSDRGWAGFNTNDVADAAGVSIGSLYQYFPDKQALVEAIRQHHLNDVLAVIRTVGSGEKHPGQLVDELVDGMIAAHSIHPELHRVLLDIAPPHSSAISAHSVFEAQYLARYRAVVEAYPGSRGRAVNSMVAQVLCAAVEGVIHGAARSGTLKSKELKEELVHLVCSYLG
ncbi:TetR/AcrR family transcriptional regulator [Pseudomonas sp. TH31]|uniref:TetR/AcrR family transcriptional regulator n=1 Tax=Pseudomonas sp. TH31 TaxID=2796396 RepID=UPI001913B4C4|nr:TetR/AcrR family transcriptional regulator [Pseudomonas sp. TH31]MBK5418066.1 TetR/AcrR family transcriptional regulator [Pseudomonas sp. TH31]